MVISIFLFFRGLVISSKLDNSEGVNKGYVSFETLEQANNCIQECSQGTVKLGSLVISAVLNKINYQSASSNNNK